MIEYVQCIDIVFRADDPGQAEKHKQYLINLLKAHPLVTEIVPSGQIEEMT